MPAGDLIEQAEVVVEFARRMSPITGPFLAGSVGFGIVQELIHTAHALPYALIHEAVVVLGEHHHLQHIAVAPRIPIIDDFIGFSVQRKPPFVLPFQVRNSDAVVQFLVQALGNDGIDLVHLCVQKIVRPCQKSTYLSAAEVDDLVGVIGEVAPIVLAVQVGGKHPRGALTLHPYAIDDLIQEASLAFCQLGKDEVAECIVVGSLLGLHGLAVARALVGEIIGGNIHLPLVIEALLSTLNQPLLVVARETVPSGSVGIRRIVYPFLVANKPLRYLLLGILPRETVALLGTKYPQRKDKEEN